MKLKRYIIASELIIIIIPLIIISLILLITITDNLRQEAYNKNQMLARVTAGQVAEKMNAPYVLLKQIKDNYLNNKDDYQKLSFAMDSIITNYDFFESIELIDANGAVKLVAPHNEAIVNIDRSRQDFYSQIRQGSPVFWSQSFLSIQTGRPIVVLAIPAGEMILVGYLNLQDISKLSGYFEEKYGNGVSVSITDENGVLLSHSNLSYVQERKYDGNIKLLKGKQLAQPQTVTNDQKKMLVSLAPVDNLRWYILVAQEENFAYALSEKITSTFVFTIICSLFLALYLERYKIKNLLGSFDKLKREMDAVSQGEYSRKISQGAFDELNEVADVFNGMSESVKERREKDFLISQVAMMVLANEPLEEIVNFICVSISRLLKLKFAWMAWANKDGSITAYAASGEALDYLQSLKYRWDDTPAGNGPVGLSIREKKIVKTNIDDPIYRLWAPRAHKFGVGSAVSIPVSTKETVVGALCLYAAEKDYFSEERLAPLLTIVQQIAVAINAYEAYRHLNFLKESLEAAADGILITDMEGGYVWANKAFESITGHSLADISKQGVDLLGDGQYHSAAYYEEARQVLKDGGIWWGEREGQRKDGSRYLAEVTISPVVDNLGSVANNIFVFHDVTERKQLEAEIENNRHIVARNERLASLGTMAAGIAHEINQPLNVIKILAAGIEISHELGKLDPETLLSRTRDISAQVDRIDGIIKHMRALVFDDRSDSPVPCDVNLIVEKSLDLFKAQLAAHDIYFRISLNADGFALAEELKLEEVIINLVNNAMQSLDKLERENKEIFIETKSEAGWVLIDVADNGAGVEQAIKEKIFEPFFTTKQVGGGMGLGLSIAHSIIRSFGGGLTLSDNYPRGALFRIKLAAAADNDMPA